MEENYELDYKAMFEQLLKMIDGRFAVENEYCEMIRYLQANTPVITAVTSNMLSLPISDQILVLRAFKQMGDVCVYLQGKHKFEFDV